MEPEFSLPCSQQLNTWLSPEPVESSPYSHTLLINIHFNTMLRFLLGFLTNSVSISPLYRVWYVSGPLHTACFNQLNNIWLRSDGSLYPNDLPSN
jgi:hypothetical protein